MGVRLNKVLTELNIGLQTAVDFLKNKKSLGEIKDDANVNTKISDDQYDALVKEFKGDKDVKKQANMIFPKKEKKPKEQKPKPEVKVEGREEPRQEFKPLGKIDLDSLGKKPAAPKSAEPAPAPKAAAEPEVEVKVEKEQPVSEPKKEEVKPVEQPVEVKVEQPKPEPQPVVEEKVVVEEAAPEVRPQPQPQVQPVSQPTQKDEVKVFKLKTEKKIGTTNLNVVGKIDLDALNQSTRPKKKTKEERRKEREEKQAQQRGGSNGEKKKRERIRGGKVDIEAAASGQDGNGKNKKNKNKGGNQNFQDNTSQQGGGKNKKKNRPVKPLEVDDEAVARQVKETLARLTSKNQNKKGAKYRREKRDAVQERMSEEMAAEAAQSKVLKLTEFVTVSELATMMNVGVNQVIGTCMSIGIMVSINQRLDAETINIVADEFGFTTEYVSAEVQNAITEEEDDENDLLTRAPIVTVMGHVDHGKTSLLDFIRNTNVIAGEAGGITQHIGAYNVKLKDGRQITFLDTPGHEAFTAMRARGAQVTDIAIIIIAADDSVMPTTKEAIAHAQAANVPMVFAINKIDKPGANPDKIREDLANMNLLVEEWGGKYQCQEISA
ncbi:MAG: translation initiation factor IF-2 N-terminal domain-containing protein, partial [Prevotella sp.]|nr:translation initiation factor IF-2 N-terminal domain-containing protein [Prevotella sp.]